MYNQHSPRLQRLKRDRSPCGCSPLIDIPQILSRTCVQQVVWLPRTSSTNTAIMEMARQNPDLPLLLGAEEQTAGRGRNQHQWWSSTGALTFSLLIAPEQSGIQPDQWPILSMATGLAVCRTLEAHLPHHQIQVKWPNDVYANGRKISGILLETISDFPQLLVVGVGINVNNSLHRAEESLQRIATSMTDQAQIRFDRTEVLCLFLQTFAEELEALSRHDPQLLNRCRHRCYLTGRLLTVHDLQKDVTGMCLGIDDDGALRIMTDSGPRRFLTGQITRID